MKFTDENRSRNVSKQCALSISLVILTAAAGRAGFTTFETTGADPTFVTPTRDAFRAAIGGGALAGANGSFGGIRREINWDGVPDAFADPNPFPANFFNVNSPRGVVLSTPGTGFLVSASAGQPTPTLFGFPNDFQVFSPQRLFTAVISNITDVTFFVPGTTTPATTSAFGAIFTDVETFGTSRIEFFDTSNTLLYSRDVIPNFNQWQSFVGAIATAGEQISRVRITTAVNTIVSNGVLANPSDDVAAMDDFIYAEPTVVPEPSALALVACGLWAINVVRRRRD